MDAKMIHVEGLGGLSADGGQGMYDTVYGKIELQGGWMNKPVEFMGKDLGQII
jgi:hypothetical protein